MYNILLILLHTTLILTFCGGIAVLVLRNIEHRLPHLSRLLWLSVLLTGWCWMPAVVEVPYHLAGTPAF